MPSGTEAASGPIDVPTTSRVNGSSSTSRMTNGVDMMTLINRLTARFITLFLQMPPLLVIYDSSPSGIPITMASKSAIPHISKVSMNAGNKLSISSV